MEHPVFAARYQPQACTLEFDLTDASLVDVVADVYVGAGQPATASLCDPASLQRGLFYGHNAFLLERPIVFDADGAATLLCGLRVRQRRRAALTQLAERMLSGLSGEPADAADPPAETREYVLLMRAEASAPHVEGGSDVDSVYFSSSASPLWPSGAPCPPTRIGTDAIQSTRRATSSELHDGVTLLLALSAVALCDV